MLLPFEYDKFFGKCQAYKPDPAYIPSAENSLLPLNFPFKFDRFE